jgi:hypothetical protein
MVSNELGLLDVAMMTFVPMAIAAALLRIKGVVGGLVIAVIIAVLGFVFVSLSGSHMFVGLLAAMAGLLVGGKVSDWQERKRTQQAAEGERRSRDVRFK